MIFDWFRKNKSEQFSLPSPLNLRLGGAVELDLLPLQMVAEKLRMALPMGAQTIEAAGFVELGGGASLSRFYTADDGFFQISTTGGHETQHIDDIKLFVFEQTHSLTSQRGVDFWVSDSGTIGRETFTLGETVYQRVWDNSVPGRIEPVKLLEVVHNREADSEPYEVDHLAMLYQREISGCDRMEYLLASLEFTSEDEATAVVSLGVDLDMSSMSVL